MKKHILMLAIVTYTVSIFAQIGTHIPSDRLPTLEDSWWEPVESVLPWQNAGCLKQLREEGGFEVTLYQDVSQLAPNDLNNAINTIMLTNPDHNILFYFPPGDYNFTETIEINQDNIVFKGAGAEQTILHFTMDYDYYRYTYTEYPEIVILRWRYQDCFDLNSTNNIGFEDFKVERTDNLIYHEIINPTTVLEFSGVNFSISGSSNIWISGIHSYRAPRHHVSIGSYSHHVEITGCFIDESLHRVGGGNGYGVVLGNEVYKCLVENNIFRELRHAMIFGDHSYHNVLAYNYSRENCSQGSTFYDPADICFHGHSSYDDGPEFNLVKGNIARYITFDYSHGKNRIGNLIFRNRAKAFSDWEMDPLHPQEDNDDEVIVNNYFDWSDEWHLYFPWSTHGEGHFAFNNKCRNIIESWYAFFEEPFLWEDISYYRSGMPDFVPSHQWPFHPTNDDTTGDISDNPAKDRWYSAGTKTVLAGSENITTNCYLTGNVNTGNALVKIIPLDGQFSGAISTYCDGNGDYIATVNEEYYGYFDIQYSKEGYITDYIRNFEITTINQSLTITQDFTLYPITDPTNINVSNEENIPAFRNIQDAVEYLSAHNSGTINIFPGTYIGDLNKNISWYPDMQPEGLHITIRGIGEAIIDCEGSGIAFNFNLPSFYNYNENDIIDNLIIQNAHQGIVIEHGSPIIKNNTIENSETPIYSEMHGAGISCYSSATIEDNEILDNIGNWIVGYETYGGGIYVENNTTKTTIIKNNLVSGNSANNGGGIYCTGSGKIILDGNEITGNTLEQGSGSSPYPEHGTGIYCFDCDDLEVRNNLIYNNLTYLPTTIGFVFSSINCDEVIIENNTIVENTNQTGIYLDTTSPAIINNNIVANNEKGIYKAAGDDPIITYCCISKNLSGNYNGLPSGIGCLADVEPELDEETYQPLWISDAKSPCINVGDPALSLDPDGSPPDIGAICAINHKIETIELIDTSDGINWKCFPVLDDLYAEEDIAANVLYDIMLPPYPAALELVETQGGDNDIYFDGYNWLHDEQQFASVKGYKLKMNEAATIEIAGFLENPEQTITLEGGILNWIGYFREESMDPFDALAAVLDKINRITTRSFTYIKLADNSWLGVGDLPRDPTLNYGDLVIVNCTESCSFFWGEDGGGTVPKEIRSTSQDFTYTEEADYIPVFVELDLEALDNPTEIGIFVENECKGAEVIEDSLVQIRAYVFNDSMMFDPGTVEFQLSYGSRSENRLIDKYTLKENLGDAGHIEQLDFLKTQNSYYLISLTDSDNNLPEITKTSLEQNFPNPFNPITTINYSLEEDGNVEMIVYNIRGQKAKTLINGNQTSGFYNAVWDGKDDAGKAVSSGVYLYRLSTSKKTLNKKMLLLK